MNLLSLVSLCSIILASLSQVKSAETWSLHLVRRGNVTYRPASELTNFTAVRACLVEGFGLQAEPKDLKIFSQNGEDGIISYIFNCIGVTDKFFVEFGTENGSETNSRILREHYNWSGLLLDGNHTNPAINLHQAFIYSENIVQLLQNHQVPKPQFDMLSADIDLNTFWVLREILAGGYRPRLLVVEFNKNLDPDQSHASVYLPDEVWFYGDSDGKMANCYFGASMLALERLVRRFGYSTVGIDRNGVNIFFVQNSGLGGQGLSQSVTDAKFAYKFDSLHGVCPNTMWLAVPSDVAFEKPEFRTQMPLVMLRHRFEGGRRRLYEVKTDPLLHVGTCPRGNSSLSVEERREYEAQHSRKERVRSSMSRKERAHAKKPIL